MNTATKYTRLLCAVFFIAPLLADPAFVYGAAPKTQLRVAYSSISGSAIVPFIALDKGLFAKYDLDVELIYVAGSQAMQSLLSGTTPIGIQGIEPVFRVNAQGGDSVMILGLVTKPPFSIIVRPEIKDYRELRGKPMGITRYGSSTDLLLRLTLDKWGLKPETDVPILQMGGVPPIPGRHAIEKDFRRTAVAAHFGKSETGRISRTRGYRGSRAGVSGCRSRHAPLVHQTASGSRARLRQSHRRSECDV